MEGAILKSAGSKKGLLNRNSFENGEVKRKESWFTRKVHDIVLLIEIFENGEVNLPESWKNVDFKSSGDI